MHFSRGSRNLLRLLQGSRAPTRAVVSSAVVPVDYRHFPFKSVQSFAEAAASSPEEPDDEVTSPEFAPPSPAEGGAVHSTSASAGNTKSYCRSKRFPFLSDHNAMEELGDRIKALESATTSVRFSPTSHFCIRLDGVAFHTLTRGFFKPFDKRVLDAMMFTARDLMERNPWASMAYVESDEITLLAPSKVSLIEEARQERAEKHATDAAEVGKSGDDSTSEAEAPQQTPVKKAKRTKTQGMKGLLAPKMEADETPKEGYMHPYDGRVFKLVSISAALAAARFNYHLENVLKDVPVREPHPQVVSSRNCVRPTTHDYLSPLTEATLRTARLHTWTFDSRAFVVPDAETLADCVYWRSAHDCIRNAINALARSQFSHSQLGGMSLRSVIEMLEDQHGIDPLTHLEPRVLYGTFIKREWYQLPPEECIDPETGGPGAPLYRTRLKCAPVNWKDWTREERNKFAVAKYWPTGGVPGEFPAFNSPSTIDYRYRPPHRGATEA